MGLEGRQAVITGGDGGLGRAVVEAFVLAGATCHLPTLAAAAPEARPEVRITGKVDLTDDGAVTAYFAGLPPLWASVHLAGGYAAKPIAASPVRAQNPTVPVTYRGGGPGSRYHVTMRRSVISTSAMGFPVATAASSNCC